MKTSELIGPALDWAVAKCEGEIESVQFSALASSKHYFAPSKKWSQGGPIIERENIHLIKQVDWLASINREELIGWRLLQYGPTPLIAAMRCLVASKLGNEVDIPEELLT